MFMSYTQNNYPQNFFQSPIDIKIAIAGTFGELRHNHFHSGIDIKTRQKENIPIYAAQDGYIARIKVSSRGLGKALYINHPNGFTTVYAHLNSFNPEIDKLVKEKHYKLNKNEIDFSFKKDAVRIYKGDLIALSGNTGSSTGPHLHFEIRDTESQKIINPMLFNLPILDTSSPIIKAILVYHQNGSKEIVEVEAINHNTYQLPSLINIENPFQLAINTFDLLDAAPNKNGIYSIELYLNGELFHQNIMETFGFYETRYINTHIDYAFFKNNGIKFQKCFLDSYNELSTNKKHTNKKIGDSLTNGTHNIKIIIKDSYNNESTLNMDFNYTFHKYPTQKLPTNLIYANQIFEFDTTSCKIYLPSYSLYNDQPFTYQEMKDPKLDYPLYKILDDSIPSHKKFIISIKATNLKKELREKIIMVRYEDQKYNYIKSKWSNDQIIGQTNSFGTFTLLVDTIKPVIQYKKIADNEIAFKIYDELSGVNNYQGKIDDKWVLMEYDYKTKIVKHKFEKTHDILNNKFTLQVTDQVNNINEIIIDLK